MKYISLLCCLRTALATHWLISVKRFMPLCECVITHTDMWHQGCVCPHAGDREWPGGNVCYPGCWKLSSCFSPLRCYWATSGCVMGECGNSVLHHPSICSEKMNSASPALWPGGGTDLIPCWWTLGTIRLVTPLPIPLPNSYSSPHSSIMGR